MRRVPVIIRCQIRSFKRVTKFISSPDDLELIECMAQTLLYSIQDIQGAVFGYVHNDEINFIIKNDQTFESEPWFSNEIQNMASVAASLCTLNFSRSAKNLPLHGDVLFNSIVSVRPYIGEVVNYLIWRQNICHNTAVHEAAETELVGKLGKRTGLNLIKDKTTTEKLELMAEQNIEWDSYSSSFRRGIGAYKIPTLFQTQNGTISKNKWNLNYNLPFFYLEKDFISNILINNSDVYRA